MDQFSCSLCGSKKSEHVFSAFDFDYSIKSFEVVRCVECRLAKTHPTLDPASMEKYYSSDYYGSGTKKFPPTIELLTVLSSKFRSRKILNALSHTTPKGDQFHVLDIGCGRANLLRQLNRMGCECHGIERENFSSDGNEIDIKIHRAALEDVNFEKSYFDAVIIWHVLEHLHVPFEILDEVARVTRIGGIAAIAVPNFSSFQSRYFKSNWFHLDLPRHIYHFDVDNLIRALTQMGFKIQSVSTCSLEQNLFGFIQSLMNSSKFLGRQNKFYQLLKQYSGFANNLKLAGWLAFTLIIFPFALAEFVISCIFKKGASVIIFAQKT